MFTCLCKIRPLLSCLVLSVMAHFFCVHALGLFTALEFAPAVNRPQGVMVDLATVPPTRTAPSEVRPTREIAPPPLPAPAPVKSAAPPPEPKAEASLPASSTKPEQLPEAKVLPAVERPDPGQEMQRRSSAVAEKGVSGAEADAVFLQEEKPGGALLSSRHEKLVYRITMFQFPVGSAELESGFDNGDTVISLRVRSNAVFSEIFPVDNLVETRHVRGGFIMARIRQSEGKFRSDEMFTINPGKKRVTWFDNLNGRTRATVVPQGDLLDTLSAIYYLRSRRLEVGQTETLRIFDSESYVEVPVEVLRSEEMLLPNLVKINTLVVHPLRKTAGIFRSSGDMLIWLTDDDNRVPLKIVTTIPLGQVTAELVSAESIPHGADKGDAAARDMEIYPPQAGQVTGQGPAGGQKPK